MGAPLIIYVYGNLSAQNEIETAILKYSDDFTSLNVESSGGCGYKVFIMDEKEIDLLGVDIKDYGWLQDTAKVDFEEPVGAGSDAVRGSLTTSAAWQDLVVKTCTEPYTLNKIIITFSGDAHHCKLLLNDGLIAEYIIDHLVIDYPPIAAATEGDTFKIQIQKLAGSDVTAIGYLYGEE
jgi:hypothetical protein